MFVAHAFDDFVPVQGTANLLLVMKKVGVPSELHIYDAGWHGYAPTARAGYGAGRLRDGCGRSVADRHP